MTTVLDHLRADDREHVGYIEMTDEGLFIPYDLLRRRCGEPMESTEAEEGQVPGSGVTTFKA